MPSRGTPFRTARGFARPLHFAPALAAEQRARTEAETAQQVSTFLTGLFRSSDPQNSRGATLTAREILDLFGQLHAEGQTVVIVTHDPGIAANCRRQVRLHDGRIAEDFKLSTGTWVNFALMLADRQ